MTLIVLLDDCGWCKRPLSLGLREYLATPEGLKYCTESCFFQSRRATFKRTRTCDWCKHIRHAVNYVDFQDGVTQLQFCSDKCLNQYKMQVFCNETQAHLDMNPHLKEANTELASNALITPDLWFNICRDRPESPSMSDQSHSPTPPRLRQEMPMENLETKRPPSLSLPANASHTNHVNKIPRYARRRHQRAQLQAAGPPRPNGSAATAPKNVRPIEMRSTNSVRSTQRPPQCIDLSCGRKPSPTHLPSNAPEQQHPKPPSETQITRFPTPFVTLTVPYPIIVPIPIPVPIPLPLESFIQAAKLKMQLDQKSKYNAPASHGAQRNLPANSATDAIDLVVPDAMDEPLDFRVRKNSSAECNAVKANKWKSNHQIGDIDGQTKDNGNGNCPPRKRKRAFDSNHI